MANQIEDLINGSRKQSNSQPQQMQQQNSQVNGFQQYFNDPRMQKVYDYVNQHGGNPQQAFFNICKETMQNPMIIFNKLMGM